MFQPRVTCICNTFNRPTFHKLILLEEAVMSFLLQTYPNKELIIVNDCAEQKLVCNYPCVRVINLPKRMETLSDKIELAIANSDGEAFCRWDDDDINLPWRLNLSVEALGTVGHDLHWKPNAYWYCPKEQQAEVVVGAANTHIQAIWSRECLKRIGGYPKGHTGDEDQAFDKRLREHGLHFQTEMAPAHLFYLYRWGVSNNHLSGTNNMKHRWEQNGESVVHGTYEIHPRWARDYVKEKRA